MHTTSGGSVGRVISVAFLKHFAVYYLGTEEHAVAAAAVGVKRLMPSSDNGTYKYRKTHGLHEKVGRSLKRWTTRFEIHRKVTGSTACRAKKVILLYVLLYKIRPP